ncbi:MAG: hypothetical protein ACRDRL_07770 [Sciscionella sp.]
MEPQVFVDLRTVLQFDDDAARSLNRRCLRMKPKIMLIAHGACGADQSAGGGAEWENRVRV